MIISSLEKMTGGRLNFIIDKFNYLFFFCILIKLLIKKERERERVKTDFCL